MKQTRLHRIFLIMILALGMTGGSFIVTKAASTETPLWVGHPSAIWRVEHVDATCTTDGYHREGIWCQACKKYKTDSIVNEETYPSFGGHTEADPVEENHVDATCTIGGSYDMVVYCSVCEEELSRETVTSEALGHTHADPIKENLVDATCDIEGSYDEVIYCATCEEELSRDARILPPLGHKPCEPVEENRVEATADKDGSYDEVVYCETCEQELSRETINTAIHIPKQIVVEDPIMGDTRVADIDDNGRAVIKGFFKNLNTGGSAKETYTMEVAGKAYTFTVYSDGTVSGNLPKGFSVNGYDLIVETKEPLDINIVDRGATSSISYEPELGVPEKGGEEDDGYWAPIIPEVPAEVDATYNPTPSTSAPRSHNNAADEVVTAGTTTTNTGGTNTANTANTTPAVTPAEEQVAAVEEALEVPSILADLLGGSHDADSTDGSIGEEIGVTPSKLLIAADIALVAGLIVGLCALWKLGILKF